MPVWLRAGLVASWREIIAVLFLTIGYYVYTSTRIGFYRFNGYYINLQPSNYSLLHLMAGESAILALLLVFLRWRGWTPSDFKIRLGLWSSLQGAFLLIAWIASGFCTFWILYVLQKHHYSLGLYAVIGSHPKIHRVGLSWMILIVGDIVNAYFEEVTVMGFAFNQFAAKRGPLFALVLTTFLRLAYHTWKQPAYLVEAGIAFLIFGVFYWRTRKLWPLILAHASFDILDDALGKLLALLF